MSSEQHEICIVPAALEYVESFRECLDSVARERRWLMSLQAHPPAEAREFWEKIIAEDAPAFFALNGPQVVGWVDIKFFQLEGLRHRGALGMGIHSNYRGQGIGTRLMEAALAKARQRGLMRVDLTVYATNTAAIALYRKLGFIEEGRMVKGRYIDGRFDDVIHMGLIFSENLPQE
ncbi:MAG TPA: GNAT family N-acetyltransferase [Pirellulales bacterium]|nr:GNAT family N-acetyltransferase [Pirellulales bacterium]